MSADMTMYEYCLEQPEVLQNILAGRVEYYRTFSRRLAAEKPDRLYLIASGSSLNAALAAAPFMEEILNLEVGAYASSNLPHIRGQRPFIVFISQGGVTPSTLLPPSRHCGNIHIWRLPVLKTAV